MASTFHCSVITPSGPVFEGEVRYACFPAWDGQYGVMAGMAPLLGKLGNGSLELDVDGTRQRLTISGGFAHVRSSGLTILTEHAEEAA